MRRTPLFIALTGLALALVAIAVHIADAQMPPQVANGFFGGGIGSLDGAVLSVTGNAPITSTGGNTPAIGLSTPLATGYGGTGNDAGTLPMGQCISGTTATASGINLDAAAKFLANNDHEGSGVRVNIDAEDEEACALLALVVEDANQPHE